MGGFRCGGLYWIGCLVLLLYCVFLSGIVSFIIGFYINMPDSDTCIGATSSRVNDHLIKKICYGTKNTKFRTEIYIINIALLVV